MATRKRTSGTKKAILTQSGRGVSPDGCRKPIELMDEILLTPPEFAFLALRHEQTILNDIHRGRIKVVTKGKHCDNFIPISQLAIFGWTYEMLEKVCNDLR